LSTPPSCSLSLPPKSLGPHCASPAAQTAHGEAGEAKLAGFSVPTHDMSGAFGSARNDTTTSCAQGDAGETKCPMPGMLMMVALARLFAPAFFPPGGDRGSTIA